MAGLPSLDELFEGRHFDREIIVLCVRWYLRFKLSFRDLVEMMTEGIVTLIQVRRRGTPHGCDARIISSPGTCLPPPVVECIKPDRAVGRGCHLVSTWMEVAVYECVSGEKRLGLL